MSRFFLADIERKEREIAAALPGGYDGADRAWLRREAIKQLGVALATVRDDIGLIPELPRCSVCEKPLLGVDLAEVDGQGRCCMCQWRNARRAECECAFLYEGERCRCNACRLCDRDIGAFTPVTRDAKLVPHDRECEDCHAELVRATKRERVADDWAAYGDYLRDRQREAS